MKLRKRNTECSLKDTFLCRLLLLLLHIFQCRSDSLCPRVMEARTQKKNYFERIFSPKKRTDYRVDFLLSGNAYQSQTNHHHTLSWLLRTPLLHSSQMIISWVYLCPHISATSSLWSCSLVLTENNQKRTSKRCHHCIWNPTSTCAHVSFPVWM